MDRGPSAPVLQSQGVTLLVDGDIIRYRCAFAAEKSYYALTFPDTYVEYETAKDAKTHQDEYGGILWSRKEVQPVEFALQCAKTTLEALQGRFKPVRMAILLSGPGNFRDTLAFTKPYKGNRLEAKPKHYNAVAEYLRDKWNAVTVRGIEADDAIGIRLSADPEHAVSVSTDKDLDQIAGWHYNWVDGDLYRVSRRDADFALYTQILAGDPTDNIPGVPGIGEKTAREILEGAKTSKELWERTWAAYKDRDLSWEYFIEQASLVYILREDGNGYRVPE